MKNILLALALILPASVFAADAGVAGFKIKALRVSGATGITYIKPDAVVQKNSSCNSDDFYAIHRDDDSYTQIYSALLAAAASGKTVYLWVSTEPGDCLNNRQRISVAEVNF